MAVDEAILEAHRQGMSSPTLRLYAFEPAAISFGQNQKISEEIIRRAQDRCFDIVRRPTGGRAVLHANELTYSFVASGEYGGLSPSVSGAYKEICRGLQSAFELLGVPLELGGSNVAYKQFQDCFHATTNSDLHVGGKKMIGSAQLRRRDAVLQHGSILLSQEQTLMAEILGEEVAPDVVRHANFYEVAGRVVPTNELEAAMKSGFESAFGVTLIEGVLSEVELNLVQQLVGAYQCVTPGSAGVLPALTKL
jgi:lipoate-protein ligase A